jgi:type IV secretion system protein VirB9
MVRIASFRPLPALAIAALVMVAAAGLTAREADATMSILPDGTLRFDYGRRPTPSLVCKPQYVCDIMLDSGETVLNIAIGDAARWVVASGKSGNGGTTPHIFVKPTQSGLDTNIVITTTKRLYDIALHSAPEAHHPHISFVYSDDEAAAKAAIADRERDAIARVLAGTPEVPPDRFDTNYKLSGDPGLFPDKVYNDGARTFIEWKTLPLELPAVYSVAKDGTTTPVNFRVVGTKYIVDALDPNLDLLLVAINDRRGRPERRASIRHQ